MNKTFAVFEPEDRVRMSDWGVQVTEGPRLTGVVLGYGSYKGHAGFLKVRYDSTGEEDLVAPWLWQRELDGAYGKSPDTATIGAPWQAIETSYRGFRFRSRCESRWAVYLDALSLQWDYEPQGFVLKSGPYLPDFWLPQVAMWGEVKPNKFTTTEENKCFELATLTGFPVLCLEGAPQHTPYLAALPVEDPSGTVQEFRSFMLTDEGGCASIGGRFISDPPQRIYRDALNAVAAARSARFEHGESGMSVEAEVRLRQ